MSAARLGPLARRPAPSRVSPNARTRMLERAAGIPGLLVCLRGPCPLTVDHRAAILGLRATDSQMVVVITGPLLPPVRRWTARRPENGLSAWLPRSYDPGLAALPRGPAV